MAAFGFVAGLGDMAVSNTIGSNVFDILVGLGVPWAIQTICVSYGSEVSSWLTLQDIRRFCVTAPVGITNNIQLLIVEALPVNCCPLVRCR